MAGKALQTACLTAMLLRLQRGHRQLRGSKAQGAQKLHEYQQALYGNGYTHACMLRARMLHLFLCRRIGEAASQFCLSQPSTS
jgi:hypothetical protein